MRRKNGATRKTIFLKLIKSAMLIYLRGWLGLGYSVK